MKPSPTQYQVTYNKVEGSGLAVGLRKLSLVASPPWPWLCSSSSSSLTALVALQGILEGYRMSPGTKTSPSFLGMGLSCPH